MVRKAPFFIAGRGERIRTFDILLPKQALYQTELHPETTTIITVFFSNANIKIYFMLARMGEKLISLYHMLKLLHSLPILCVLCFVGTAGAATRASDYVSANTYNNMYPYMNNAMRTGLNPGTTPSQRANQIDVLTRTIPTGNATSTTTRRVVSRSTTARSATKTGTVAAAANTATTTGTTSGTSTSRRVVARSASRSGVTSGATTARSSVATASGRNVRARTVRGNGTVTRDDAVSNTQNTATNTTSGSHTNVTAARCLADYSECMDGYCVRENTAYNRCYCSAKLSQIDAQYQPEIDSLIKQILTMRGTNRWTEAEMNEYWMSVVGKYRGENSWTNLDNALNIDWASLESRARGQNAFVTGHDYCMQHLQGCFYMAANLRDIYRSDIARDCSTYEKSLQKLKNAAESIVEAYK